MTAAQKKQSSDNPIKIMLKALGTSSIVVTLDYLTELKQLFEQHGVVFDTYGSVFDMIQYLEKNGCVTITPLDTGEYQLTGLYNYGS